MELDLSNGITLNWGTPVLAFSMPDAEPVNTQLKALILDRKNASVGVTKSNLGGWH